VIRRAPAVAALVLLAVLLAGPLAAQNLSPELTGAVRGYKLDEKGASAVVKTLEELTAYVVKNPEVMKQSAAMMKLSDAERIKQMDRDPQTAGILKANGLTARDYFVGLLAIRAASQAAGGGKEGLAALASPGNVAVLKANPALGARLKKADAGGR